MLDESFIHPITILSALPSAGVGALPSLMLFGYDLSVIAIARHHPADRHREEERDHDDRLRARGGAHRRQVARCEAIHEACLLRFRPIMMTTFSRADRRPAARARDTAPARSCAARSASPSSAVCCCRRADALHDARHLPLPRSPRAPIRRESRPASRAWPRRQADRLSVVERHDHVIGGEGTAGCMSPPPSPAEPGRAVEIRRRARWRNR